MAERSRVKGLWDKINSSPNAREEPYLIYANYYLCIEENAAAAGSIHST
jgi:hypothetical protein